VAPGHVAPVVAARVPLEGEVVEARRRVVARAAGVVEPAVGGEEVEGGAPLEEAWGLEVLSLVLEITILLCGTVKGTVMVMFGFEVFGLEVKESRVQQFGSTLGSCEDIHGSMFVWIVSHRDLRKKRESMKTTLLRFENEKTDENK